MRISTGMAKKRKPPYRPPVLDIGPSTEAQMSGAGAVEVRGENSAVFMQKRRLHVLQVMLKKDKISLRQCAAGIRLHDLYCMTELSAESAFSRIFVDASPRPDETTLAQTIRITEFVDLFHTVPKDMKRVVWHVVVKDRQLRAGLSRNSMEASMHTAMLLVALDLLANHLGV